MSLDLTSLLDENNTTVQLSQEGFIARFNDLGRIMLAVPDLYEAGKNGSDKLIKSLQTDFNENWIVTSTRFEYETEGLEANVIHYFGSTVISPSRKRIIIPYFNWDTFDTVLSREHGLEFIQKIFNTTDEADELKRVLNRLSNKNPDKIRFRTLSPNERKSVPNRAAGLAYDDGGGFRIGGDVISSSGRSRGVFENPAGRALNVPQEITTDHGLLHDFVSGINKRAECVYFSKIQDISGFTKYAGLFCFYNTRFAVSLTVPGKELGVKECDNQLSVLLHQNKSTSDKLSDICDVFKPMYSRVIKYELQNNDFVDVDDVEVFGEPRIKMVKK